MVAKEFHSSTRAFLCGGDPGWPRFVGLDRTSSGTRSARKGRLATNPWRSGALGVASLADGGSVNPASVYQCRLQLSEVCTYL